MGLLQQNEKQYYVGRKEFEGDGTTTVFTVTEIQEAFHGSLSVAPGTTNEKVKSLTSNRSVAGKTKTKAVTKVRTKKAKSSGKLGVSKRVSTKSASIVSVGKEKPSPESKKDCCDKDGKLLTKVNDKK